MTGFLDSYRVEERRRAHAALHAKTRAARLPADKANVDALARASRRQCSDDAPPDDFDIHPKDM